MKLNYHNRNINLVEFKHNGCGIAMRQTVPYDSGLDYMSTTEGDTLHLEFSDLTEVDGLIHMLENFKKTCLGSWGYFTNTTYKE